MTLASFLRQFSARAAALVVSLGCVGAASAADQTPPYPSAFAAPAAAPAAACPTCEGAAAPAACESCGSKYSLFHKKGCRHPYQPHLCPGACFGYFQTQWHRWENVCPIPYQGTDLADAPPRPTPAINPPLIPAKPADTKGSSDAPLPKPVTKPAIPSPPTINPGSGK